MAVKSLLVHPFPSSFFDPKNVVIYLSLYFFYYVIWNIQDCGDVCQLRDPFAFRYSDPLLIERLYGRYVRIIPSIFSFTLVKFESIFVIVFSREKPSSVKLSVHSKPRLLHIVSVWSVLTPMGMTLVFSTLQERPLILWKSVKYFFAKIRLFLE